MAGNFLKTLFTPPALALQEEHGSRKSYARMAASGEADRDRLTAREAEFIAGRDSFYMASRTSDGWPYVQHRGGPPGFLKVIDDGRIGFADYTGNRQYISTANIKADGRVALFLMDYPGRRRLKMIGHGRILSLADEPDIAAHLRDSDYNAAIERFFLIEVVGFDWNCPQHITPRFSEAEIADHVAPLHEEIAQLKAEIEALKAGDSDTATLDS